MNAERWPKNGPVPSRPVNGCNAMRWTTMNRLRSLLSLLALREQPLSHCGPGFLFAMVAALALRPAVAGDLRVLEHPPDFYGHLLTLADRQFEARSEELKGILAADDAEHQLKERRRQLKRHYRNILGDLPGDKTPLKASVEGTIDTDHYTIERIAYQSRPGFYVTANLYVPAAGSPPYPAVLVACGHSMSGKAAVTYQQAAILLARNGIVALVVDPIGQAERFQFLDASGNKIRNRDGIKHSLIDTNSLLVGRTMVGYMAWDNVRGIDYLLSREEVDGSRIGVTGNSGGGTQTTFLMALDDRIAAAAPTGYIMTEQRKFHHRGPADSCQYLPFAGRWVPEHADYITMFAPNPVIILHAESDQIFDVRATRAAFRESRQVYEALGVPQNVEMFTSPGRHGFHKPLREKMVWWMRLWLSNDDTPVEEPELAVQTESDLLVTDTGYAATHWEDSLTTADLNMQRGLELAGRREAFWKEHSESECLEQVARLIGLRRFTKEPEVEHTGTVERDGYRIEKVIIRHEHGLPVPGLLFVPDGVAGETPAMVGRQTK